MNDINVETFLASFRIYTQGNVFGFCSIRTQIWIVITIFRLIWNRTDVRLVPNQSENGKYNLISL